MSKGTDLTAAQRLLAAGLTQVGWVAPSRMTYEQWAEVGKLFRGAQRQMTFAIGDWVNAGEERFGEKYTQAIDYTGMDYDYLRQVASTARAWPLEQRVWDLPFSYYRVTKSLPHEQRVRIMEEAIKRGLSRIALSAVVREYKMLEAAPEDAVVEQDVDVPEPEKPKMVVDASPERLAKECNVPDETLMDRIEEEEPILTVPEGLFDGDPPYGDMADWAYDDDFMKAIWRQVCVVCMGLSDKPLPRTFIAERVNRWLAMISKEEA